MQAIGFPGAFARLGVEIVEVPEAPVQEEVLADVAERALHLAIGLRPVGFAGPHRRGTVAWFDSRCFRIAAMLHGEQSELSSVCSAGNFRCLSRSVAIPLPIWKIISLQNTAATKERSRIRNIQRDTVCSMLLP